jgi:drug/metabolite transporter (DMT)-like permease
MAKHIRDNLMASYIAYIIAFLAMTSYASLGAMAKKISAEGISGYQLIFLNSILLGVFGLIAILLTDRDFAVYKNLQASTWGWIILWAGMNFLGFVLYLYAIQRIPVTEYQIMYLASPIIAAILAFVILSEPFQLKHLIGGIIVAVGVYIAIRK